jgi:1,4-alpha-glucan branching enzyme
MPPPDTFPSLLTEDDVFWLREGTHSRLHHKLGAHPGVVDGAWGTHFSVWAPNATSVSLVGNFNAWDGDAHPLRARPGPASGVWETFAPGVGKGALYKYRVRRGDYVMDKADPFATACETPPSTASIVHAPAHRWGDGRWMATRGAHNALSAPMSIYEVHLGSFRRVPEDGDRSLGYREIAPRLADHVIARGYTHVELLPVMEHPFYGSWGYQVTGFFAPTHRYGSPEDFMYFVDHLHQRGIGVILDWVPSHFPGDGHGLAYFDGTHLFEHEDPRLGHHPDWDSKIFDYSRREVRAFLMSSAISWLERYHVDGLRVDAVASMLYLDYSRKEGEWLPNEHGGRENLGAVAFLRQLNEAVYRDFPDVQVIAEESTSWPMVSRPNYVGGLGFGMKWDMGWMHDAIRYLERDPIHRRWHHNEVTFRSLYAFSENFVLPLSHDEVVYGKGSLINKMPGDRWQKFANLRLLFGWQYAQPGKKLLFMGGDIAQWREWNHDGSLDWDLVEEGDNDEHTGIAKLVTDLNALYRREPAMHVFDTDARGFKWVSGADAEHSVITFLRRGEDGTPPILCAINFTPVVRYEYGVALPSAGRWLEVLNTDSPSYGGSGVGNLGGVESIEEPLYDFPCSAKITLPPLAALFFRAPDGMTENAAR